MKIRVLVAILLASSIAFAGQDESVGQRKPAMFAGQTSTMQAVVEEIDHEARLVTLRKQDGSTVTFTPSPEVRNLDQVRAGDILHVEYSQSVNIQVVSAEGAKPAAGGMSAVTRSERGEMPAMAAVDTQVLLARVVDIDVPNMTYKLEFPDGAINEYRAMVKENLEAAEVGDMVAIEVTESVLAAVEAVDRAE
jgi:Cu/Ag efflux protein CusF